jgi:outer membrane protein OmpA-like peptidoglycan-associated protein/opacity protein-like surface antigen
MSEERVSFMRETVDFIERQPSVLARWSRGSGYAWVLPAVCFVCLYGRVEQARAEPGRLEVGAKLAPSLERHLGERVGSNAENAFKSGYSFGAGLRYALSRDWLSVQTELLYATRGSNVDLEGRTEGSFYFTYLEIPLLARARFPLSDEVRPTLSGYAMLGPSVSFLLGAEGEDAGGTMSLGREGLNEVDLGVIAGLGVTWEVTPEWVLSLEARYDHGFRDAFNDADTKNQAFLLTFGVDFTLVHGDNDGDRVADYRDRCRTPPRESSDAKGTGSPKKVIGHLETWNGYLDDDGCPDNDDEDGDTILARTDRCPTEPETKNNYQDDDGCPDTVFRDPDQDGLAGAEDQCPDKSFSLAKNIKYDKDKYPQLKPGCPVVSRDSYGLVLDPPLEFGQGAHQVGAKQALILDEVALFLKAEQPQLCLSVEGHADSDFPSDFQGDRGETNKKESLYRAQNVRRYLISGGVEAEQMVTKGHGDRRRISTEETAAGQSKNRRVQLVIVEQSVCDEASRPKRPGRQRAP